MRTTFVILFSSIVRVVAAPLVFSSVCTARDVSIGDIRVVLPTPVGLRDVTDQDSAAVRVLTGVVRPPNQKLAIFAGDALFPQIHASKNRDLESRIWDEPKFSKFVAYIKETASVEVNEGKFDLLSSGWKANADAVVKRELGIKLLIDVGKPALLKASDEGPRHITLPFLMRVSVDKSDLVMVGTTSFLLIKGKLLYLYYYDRFDGL
jgi:hypothetical protein